MMMAMAQQTPRTRFHLMHEKPWILILMVLVTIRIRMMMAMAQHLSDAFPLNASETLDTG